MSQPVALLFIIAERVQTQKLPACAGGSLLIVTWQDGTWRWKHSWHGCDSWNNTGTRPLKTRQLPNDTQCIITNRCVAFAFLSKFPFTLRNIAQLDKFRLAWGSAAAQVPVIIWQNPARRVSLPRCYLSPLHFGQTHWQHTLANLGLVSQLQHSHVGVRRGIKIWMDRNVRNLLGRKEKRNDVKMDENWMRIWMNT